MKIALLIFLFIFSKHSYSVIPTENIKYPIKNLNKELLKPMSETDLDDVVNKITKSYDEFLKKNYNAKIIFNKNWSDENVNAYATKPSENEFHITVSGGIVRAKGMTKDALAVVLCHELGHHLGGAPKTNLFNGWPSAEGQADYFATSKCLKKYFLELKDQDVDVSSNIPDKVIKDCNANYSNFTDMKICVRSILASLDFANFLNNLPSTKIPVKLETPDIRVVKGNNINDYPKPQCRFDTLYAGALCTIPSDVKTSNDDTSTGQCVDQTRPGTRPKCWFFK